MENNKPFLAYLLLSVAFIILLFWQTIVSVGVNGNLKSGLKNRGGAVEQAQNTQKTLEAFVVDLLQLAEHNEGAKAIVEKYQIRKGSNAQ
ncbi:MAG: hypothetical protein LBD30_08200 [Verrucomicrobiales bacterium]|jgi:hypothetical protein|nr:hypothetical protein [Verrucomicrobiales bacterium]